MAGFPGFPKEMATFFRGLAKNNNREWFQANKETFETKVKQPMAELVNAVNATLAKSAAEFVTDPKHAIYRIYRDTRFSKDKTPYKDHIAASLEPGGFGRHGSAGLYFGISEKDVQIGGGLYMIEPDQIQIVRTLLAERHDEFRKITGAKKFRELAGELQGEKLTRPPKGFAADHPAADLLKHKQWYFFVTLEAGLALTPKLQPEIEKRLLAMIPALRFFNEPLHAAARKKERAAKMLE